MKKEFLGFINFIKEVEEEIFCEHEYEMLYENICQCSKCGKIRPQNSIFTKLEIAK